MRANQIRLWFTGVAYALMAEFRRTALAGTELARAQTNTIRVKLLKVGGLIKVSVRRVFVSMSSVFPLQRVFLQALAQLQAIYHPPS